MEPFDVAATFVSERFPLAHVAVVGGSSASGRRTKTSDIDLLVLGPDEMFAGQRTSLAASYSYAGEIVELFAYSEPGFEEWVNKDLGTYRPVLLDMLINGVPVRGAEQVGGLRARWLPILVAGPRITERELAARRYEVTDLVDDLRDATDPLEQRITADLLFEKTAELMLLSNKRWLATSKHLVRALRDWDPHRTESLAGPFLDLDFVAFADRVDDELRLAGGRTQAGFVR